MSLVLEPLKTEDMDRIVQLQWDAFEPLEANMIFPMLYPKGLTSQVIEQFRNRMLKKVEGDIVTDWYCARDPATNEIHAICQWSLEENSPQSREEIDAEYEKEATERRNRPPIEGMNTALSEAFFKTVFYAEKEIMGGAGPYVGFHLLATDPRFQRRGAGSLMLRHCLQKADELGLPVYLDSGSPGKPLYERYGFKVVREQALNCLDYGGRSDGRHWHMLRPARPSKLDAS